MGLGQMTIPIYLSTLPEGMTFTVDEISKDAPSGFWAYMSLLNGLTFPYTFQPSEISEGFPNNKRGWEADKEDLLLSNLLLTADQTIIPIYWPKILKTKDLAALDDSCLAVAYLPDDKTYVFGVTNQQDFIVKVMQGAVGAILAGYKVLWSIAAGLVAPIGGVAFAVVSFGAGAIDGI